MNKKSIIVIISVLLIAIIAVGVTAMLTVFSAEARVVRELEQASKLLKEGSYDEAILSFDKAIGIDDKRADTWLAKISAQHSVKDFNGENETEKEFFSKPYSYYEITNPIEVQTKLDDYIAEERENGADRTKLKTDFIENGWFDDETGISSCGLFDAESYGFRSTQVYNDTVYRTTIPADSICIAGGYEFVYDSSHEIRKGDVQQNINFRALTDNPFPADPITWTVSVYDNLMFCGNTPSNGKYYDIFLYDIIADEYKKIASNYTIKGFSDDMIYLFAEEKIYRMPIYGGAIEETNIPPCQDIFPGGYIVSKDGVFTIYSINDNAPIYSNSEIDGWKQYNGYLYIKMKNGDIQKLNTRTGMIETVYENKIDLDDENIGAINKITKNTIYIEDITGDVIRAVKLDGSGDVGKVNPDGTISYTNQNNSELTNQDNNSEALWSYDLLADFTFDNSIMDNVNNTSVSGNGDYTFTNGINGQCLYLDGDGDYLDLGHNYQLPKTFSLNVWIKSENENRSDAAIFAKYETNHYGPYDFYLSYNRPAFWISDGVGGNLEFISDTELSADRWYMITYVKNNNDLQIYIDGKLDMATDCGDITDNDDTVTIGRQSLMFTPYSDLEYKGFIDELKIFKKTLTEPEINELYFENAQIMR